MLNINNIDSTAKETKYWTSTTDFLSTISEKKIPVDFLTHICTH